MQALMISGSRNPQGQTARAADAVLAGLEHKGVEVERLFLPVMSVERCRQCDDAGWGICRTEGRCTIDDDLESIVAKIAAADVVIFATPVYYGDLSESMRALTDRLRRCLTHREGADSIVSKPVIGVCVAGGGGGGAPKCCVSLEYVLQRCGFDVVDMISVRRQNLAAKLPQLELVGGWLASLPRSS